ncbi:MAG: SpoIIE family protein phosphatase [Spirochaetota bacterium]|nr:MAG: SpoIIE family protein phosphatase [Spirochaetota bacterium]
MKAGKSKKLTVVAESKNLIKVRDFVVKYSSKMGLLPRQVSEVKLAVDEAVSNIIRHAYVGERGNVEIEVKKLESAVELKVMDKGVEFDWNSILEPDLYRYVETRRKGGLGIWLIKKLMDEVVFERVENKNILIMRVYLKIEEAALIKAGKGKVSIRARYALYAIALITVLIFVVYNIGSRYQIRTIRNRFIERYKAVTEQVAQTSVDLILKEDDLALINLVSSVKNSETPLDYIIITDTDGIIIAHTDIKRLFDSYRRPRGVKPLSARDSIEVFTYTARGGREYSDFAAVVKYNNLKLGEVHLGIPEDKFAEVNDLVTQRLRVAFIALFFWSTTIVGVFVLGSTFISPIRKLAEQISSISLTGQATELRLATRNPEVSRIGEAFNEIMRNLRITQGQLTDQTRLRRELQLAQEIQNALLPKSVPKLEGFELDAAYRAALEVGGDYYDFFEVDENAIGIVVADVSGKGIGSSMVMTMIRTSMRLEARGNKRASDVVNKVNRVAMGDIKKGMYVTMFYVILDSKKRMVSYASAGHNPMLLYRGDAKSVSFLNPGGIAVGIDLGHPDEFKKLITSEKLRLKKGDMLLIYTDGITEAMNEKRAQFGEQRLIDLIYKYNHLPASEFKQKLNDEIATFTKGYPQSDDITFVVVKLEMSPSEIEYSRRIHLFQLLDDDMSLEEALEQTGISEEEYLELREKREREGDEALKTEGIEEEEIQQKHATHEQVRSIVKIVRANPDYGVGRIRKLLETPEYGSHTLKDSVIKRELIRMKLDTQEKREAFAKRELPTWASYK